MKGLLYKDFLIVKKNGKVFLALILFLVIILFVSSSTTPACGSDETSIVSAALSFLPVLSAIIPLMLAVLGINCIAYDTQANWEPYAKAMPLGIKKIVAAKYITPLLCIGTGVVVSFFFALLLQAFAGRIQWIWLALSLLSSILCSTVYVSIMLPIQLKFGIEKSRIVMVLFMLILYSLFFMLKELLPQNISLESVPAFFVVPGVILLATAIYLASYFVSLRIYASKSR